MARVLLSAVSALLSLSEVISKDIIHLLFRGVQDFNEQVAAYHPAPDRMWNSALHTYHMVGVNRRYCV